MWQSGAMGSAKSIFQGINDTFTKCSSDPLRQSYLVNMPAMFKNWRMKAENRSQTTTICQWATLRAAQFTQNSPRSPEYLASLPDEELLDYINRWDEEHRYATKGEGDKTLVEVNIDALAEAFKAVYRDSILPNAGRLRFWSEHNKDIERTVYWQAMIKGMEEYVKEKRVDNIEEALTVCEWVLSQPDQDPVAGFRYGEQSGETPRWHRSRSAVGEFVGTCLEEEVNVPVQAREQVAKASLSCSAPNMIGAWTTTTQC